MVSLDVLIVRSSSGGLGNECPQKVRSRDPESGISDGHWDEFRPCEGLGHAGCRERGCRADRAYVGLVAESLRDQHVDDEIVAGVWLLGIDQDVDDSMAGGPDRPGEAMRPAIGADAGRLEVEVAEQRGESFQGAAVRSDVDSGVYVR